MLTVYDIIRAPHLTEKSVALSEDGKQVVFKVHPKANKYQIRTAIEELFGVKVDKVHTMHCAGKKKRFGQVVGRRQDYKKAVIFLKEGESFELP